MKNIVHFMYEGREFALISINGKCGMHIAQYNQAALCNLLLFITVTIIAVRNGRNGQISTDEEEVERWKGGCSYCSIHIAEAAQQ